MSPKLKTHQNTYINDFTIQNTKTNTASKENKTIRNIGPGNFNKYSNTRAKFLPLNINKSASGNRNRAFQIIFHNFVLLQFTYKYKLKIVGSSCEHGLQLNEVPYEQK